MPSSTPKILNETVEEILKTNPRTVFEAGIGNGRNGFFIREYIECWQDRVFPESWEVNITGVEIFKPYTEIPHVKSLYNKIIVGDIYEVLLHHNEKYDLTIATDVLEHLKKGRGLFCAEKLINMATKKCILNMPIGDNWMNNVVVANNPAEQHQSIWKEKDFYILANTTKTNLKTFIWEQNRKFGCLGVFQK